MNAECAPGAKEKSRLTKEEWRDYTKTVWAIANTSHAEHPAVFPLEIPHRLIKLFSFHGEVVLDPFAGVGTTGRAALALDRKAICVDQNREYVATMRREIKDGCECPDDVTVLCADSRHMHFVADDSVGLIVTSPPYWDKADYGGGLCDLGRSNSYAGFLAAVRPVFEECFRVLSPGRKLCVVTANVNQQTEHGLLTFPIAADLTVQLREIGFLLVNEIIWSKDGTGGKWGSHGQQRPIFGSYPYPPNFLFKNVHEYIVVVAKPGGSKRTGAKVRPYADLMGA